MDERPHTPRVLRTQLMRVDPMRSWSRRMVPVLGAGLVLVIAGCDTRDFSESRASILVTTATFGSGLDVDGYTLHFDGEQQARIAPNDTMSFGGLTPGDYLVSIDDVAGNCMVHGTRERPVNLRTGQLARVLFEVTCASRAANVLFESDRDGGLDLYMAGFGAQSTTRITTHPAPDYGGSVSGDGTRIAFTSRRDGNLEIYVLNRLGGAPVNVSQHEADDYSPAFSPDGSWITFVSRRQGASEIYRVRPDGSELQRVTGSIRGASDPAYLSDAELIVASMPNGVSRLQVLSVSGEILYDLTPATVDARSPGVSPDGMLVAFQGYRAGRSDIYLIRADGSNLMQLTDDFAEDGAPSFSLDGQRIAFASNRTGTFDIYIMNLDGSDVVNITRSPSYDYGPVFLPDS